MGGSDAPRTQARAANHRALLAEPAELAGRQQRDVEIRIKQARLPWVKTLEQFDFGFPALIDRKVARELAGGASVERPESVVLLDRPGADEAALAIASAVKAYEMGQPVQFKEKICGRSPCDSPRCGSFRAKDGVAFNWSRQAERCDATVTVKKMMN